MTWQEIRDTVWGAYVDNNPGAVVSILADIMFDDIDARSIEEFGGDSSLEWALETHGHLPDEALAWFKVVDMTFYETAGKFGM